MMISCPVCGVSSNPWPDYLSSKGTAVIRRLSYCGHRIDDKIVVISISTKKEADHGQK